MLTGWGWIGKGGRAPGRGGAARAVSLASRAPNALRLLVLFTIFAYFARTVPHFSDPFNVYQVLQDGMVVGLLALGQTLVMIPGGGGIDLSSNGMLALSGMLLGVLNIALGLNIWLAVGGAILAGGILGAFNGALICAARLPPFIATLATAYGSNSIALEINDTKPFPDGTRPGWPSAYPDVFLTIGGGDVQDVGWLHWIPALGGQQIPFQLLFVYAPAAPALWLVLDHTVQGRHIYAAGRKAVPVRSSR